VRDGGCACFDGAAVMGTSLPDAVGTATLTLMVTGDIRHMPSRRSLSVR